MSLFKHLFLNLILLAGISMPVTSQYSLTVEESTPAEVEGTTYRLYVNMVDPTDRMSAVFGNNEMPLSIEAAAGVYNNAFNASWSASGINPMFLPFAPEMADDTYATIGLTGPAVGDEADPSIVEDSAQPISPFFTVDASTFVESNTLTGSSYYVLNTAVNGLPDENMRVLIMQVTTTGELCGTLNYQIFPLGVGADQIQLAVSFCGPGEFEAEVPPAGGCMDELACNYDAEATEDNGSCTYPEEDYLDCDGNCLEDVNENDICDALEVFGCTVLQACNYDPLATWNDGSCDFLSCLSIGCTDPVACNFDPEALILDDSCEYANPPYDCNGECEDVNENDICDVWDTPGCVDETACNYDESATLDDGSCTYAEVGYNCDGSCVNDSDGDGVCDDDEIAGCNDINACNYEVDATENDGSCDYCSCADAGTEGYGLEVELVAEHTDGELAGMSTYRVYVTTPHNDDFLSAVFGDDEDPLDVSSTTSFYQHINGSHLGSDMFPEVYPFFPELEFDSWVTIGLDQGAGAGEAAPQSIVSTEFNWVEQFEAGGNIDIDDSVGGSWFVIDPNGTANAVSGDDMKILVMQLTTNGAPSGTINVQMFNHGSQEDVSRVALSFEGLTGTQANSCGCTDLLACNYDDTANIDDGSCEFPDPGFSCDGECIEDLDGDGICDIEDPCVGEYDECGVCNGDGIADGECDCDGNTLDALNVCGGDCEADVDADGICDDEDDCVGDYDACGICNGPGAIYDCGCADIPEGDCDCEGNQNDALGECGGDCTADADADGICDDVDDCVGEYDECGICNGDGIADGECDCAGNELDAIGICGGDCDADADMDGVCDDEDECIGVYDECGICNGPGAIYECGCADIPEGDCDCFGNQEDVLGECGGDCTADIDADGVCDDEDDCIGEYDECGVCNGDGIADGACDCDGNLPDDGYDCDGNCINDSDGDGVCDEFEIEGCTDMNACNYNELATDEDDSCEYESCAGCTDESANNYDADATIDDGSCCYLAVTGGTTVDALCNGDMGSVTVVSDGGIGVVTYTLGGESNETGVFEVSAGSYTVVISDENNCSVEVDVEVTEPDAIEVTASATDETAAGELGVGTASATGGTGEITFVWTDSSGNEVDPGGLAAGTYTVTAEDENGCTESVEVEVLFNTIVNLDPLAFGMFPNPTTGEVTIQMPEAHNDVVVKILDGVGRTVYDTQINVMQGNTVLSLGGLAAGTYNVMLSNRQGTSVRRLSIVR